jgi:hypothetical protein
MIVLDEQLLGRDIETEIRGWYSGTVYFITDLRPFTVIKDDAVPGLLCRHKHSVFVTINEKDFWKKAAADNRYCIVCFSLSDSRACEIPQMLRSVFRCPEFNTKAKRAGKIIRVTRKEISYYTSGYGKIKAVFVPNVF